MRTRSALSAVGILVLLCSTRVHFGEASCLASAVPQEERRSIETLDGTGQVPFGLWVHRWDSAWLASYVVKILAEEVLGYNTVISGTGVSSSSGLYATAGCHSPNNFSTDPECKEGSTFVHHAALEVWTYSKVTAMQQKLGRWPELVPEDAGDMGYEGIQGAYVFKPQRQQAFETEGLALEYYRSYDANWTRPWVYFDNYTAFDPSAFLVCNETGFVEVEMMNTYLEVTGDRDGLVDVDGEGTLAARCWHGSWWFAPACRNSPEHCIPFVTVNGWLLHDFMQRAAHFNMPLALAVAKSSSDWRLAARERRCLTYWSEPDPTFIDLHPNIVTFPGYNALERARNVLLSMSENTRLGKWVHNRLGLQASRLREFLFRVSITMTSINEMLLEHKLGASHEQVACDWLARNGHIWRAWVPVKTDCIPGKGLVAADGSFVVNRSLAEDCQWCSPGRFAAQHNNHLSTTYVCNECSIGTSQPNPGQLECSVCGPGTFAATNASRECARCPIGTYQHSTSSASCHVCPVPMTTIVLGAIAASECVCPEGMFRPIGGGDLGRPCQECPRGMSCKVGSAEENIPAAPGALSGGEHPKPLQMFYAKHSDPLSVYMCTSQELCPGGGFEVCSEHSLGLACGSCVEGYHRTRSGCRRCSALTRSGWLIPTVFLVLGPCAICLLYKTSQDPVIKWGSPQNAVAAAGFLTLIYLQIIATARTCYFLYPPVLGNSVDWTAYSLDFLAWLHPDCSVAVDFKQGFALTLLTPVYALLLFLFVFVASRALERALGSSRLHMDGRILMACFGSLYNTFFIGIANHSFQLFQCYEHPNVRRSLRSAPDVLCDSQTWQDLLVGAVVAVVVFCGGALTVFTYINLKAPAHFHEEDFRRRWRFLFMRFRPTVWWWGTPLLLKGVWVNLTTVLFETGHLQLVWLTFAHVLYLVVCFATLPWRSMSVSALDVGMHAMIVLLFSLLPHFVVKDKDSLQAVTGLSMACCAAPLLGACVVLLLQLRWRSRPSRTEELQLRAKILRDIFSKATEVQDMQSVLELLPTADVWTLEGATHMLHAELLSGEAGEPGQRLSRQPKRLTLLSATESERDVSTAWTSEASRDSPREKEDEQQQPPLLLGSAAAPEEKPSLQPYDIVFVTV